MLDLKIIPNVNSNSDLYIFFCEKNFSFNSKKLSFIDIDYKEINSLLLKNKDEDYFVFNYHSLKPKKITIDIFEKYFGITDSAYKKKVLTEFPSSPIKSSNLTA